MTIQEGQVFLQALSAASNVKSKNFSIASLTTLALTKRKIILALQDYESVLDEIKQKVDIKDNRYVPISTSEEHVNDHKEFVKQNNLMLKKEIQDLQLNFVDAQEMKRVLEDTNLEVATTLLIFLCKPNEESKMKAEKAA